MRRSIRSSGRKRVRRTVIGAVAMLPLAAGAVLLSAPGASAAGTTIASLLGAAGPGNGVGGFAVFGLGGGSAMSVVLSCGTAAVNGNLGAGGPGQVNIATPCAVNGNLYKASTVTVTGSGHVSGSTITNDTLVSQAVSNAESASSTFAAMPATDIAITSVGNGSYTFTATQSGINVVDLSSVNGTTGTSVLFTCGSHPGCQWVVNDAGAFHLAIGSVGVGGGMTSGDLLFNVYSNGASVSLGSAVSMTGIFLAPYSSFQVQGSWNGEAIGGLNGTVTVMSAINAPPPVTQVPVSNAEGYAIAVGIVAAALAVAQWLSRRRRTRVASA